MRGGYEGAREPLEIYSKDSKVGFLSISVSKGLGRLSIIWFAVLVSYFKLRERLVDDSEIKDDFRRPGWDILGDILGGQSGSPLEDTKPQSSKGDGFIETVAFGQIPVILGLD